MVLRFTQRERTQARDDSAHVQVRATVARAATFRRWPHAFPLLEVGADGPPIRRPQASEIPGEPPHSVLPRDPVSYTHLTLPTTPYV